MFRAENRSIKILVQISATDTTPCYLDQHFTGLYFGGGYVLNANVITVVKTSCLHGIDSFTFEALYDAPSAECSVVITQTDLLQH